MTASVNTVYFHYSGDKVIYETDSSNNILAEYTYDPQGNPATMVKNGIVYYYHVNGHGDVVSMTDQNETVVAQYNYDAYGNIISQTGTMASQNPLRYAGYRYDEATELYYLMARYYDANIGRFITRDTFHGFEDDPKSLNQYNYAHSNPVKYVDPSGYAATHVVAGRVPQLGFVKLYTTFMLIWGIKVSVTSWLYKKATDFIFKSQSLTMKGPISGSIDKKDKNGKTVQRRYYDKNGNPIKDVDYTNHGNPKAHPNVPHVHDLKNGKRGPSRAPKPGEKI